MHQWQKLCLLLSLGLPAGLFAESSPWNTKDLAEDLACDVAIPTMEFELTEEYRLHNAFLFLWASSLAESRDRGKIFSRLESWGFRDTRLIGKPKFGAFGYFAAHDAWNLLSFRGTNSFGETISNAFFLPASFQSLGFAGMGHQGMMHHFKRLLRESEAILKENDPEQKKPIFVTGHSLGGAMALFHALHLAKKGWNVVAVYTSAQPHVGDAAFYEDVATWLGPRYFRMEQADDPTPRIPPIAEARDVFGELVPCLSKPLSQFVASMNYGASRSLALEIGANLSLEYQNPETAEIEYWRKFRESLAAVKSLPALIQALEERTDVHPPPRYMCAFLQALSQGS